MMRGWANFGVLWLAVAALRLGAQAPAPAPAGQTTPATASTDANSLLTPAPPGRAKSQSPPTKITLPVLPGMTTAPGTELDRVVAIVNGDLILDSDVDQDLRLDELEPYGESNAGRAKGMLRTRAIERLINRDLILQQARLQPGNEITDAAVTKELDALRKNIPQCKEYHCETQAGWDKLLATYGFTDAELRRRWMQRMMVLAFIEQRFRLGIKITQPEIATYYTATLLPQYAEQLATPPPVEAISDRIQEVLLQQRVSSLLDDWLQSLRAQGSIVLLHPGEDAP
jgi:peptidyl-prolyl cis-trans isomerase SurA